MTLKPVKTLGRIEKSRLSPYFKTRFARSAMGVGSSKKYYACNEDGFIVLLYYINNLYGDIMQDLKQIEPQDRSDANGQNVGKKKTRRFKKYDAFVFENKLKSVPFALFCIEAAYALTLLASGFNFLAVCAIAFSMAFALMLFVQAVRNYINVWSAASFILSDASLLLYFFIWGAGNAAERFGYTILFTLIPIALAALILLFPKFKKLTKRGLTAAFCAALMLGASMFYFLACSFKAKPVVESLKDGHDDYLNSLSAYKNGENRPNIFFVLMDDMGYADISLYSYLNNKGYLNGAVEQPSILTPNIDRIADDGIFFDNFYASSPVCSPSRFGILTGRYCSRGYLDNVVFPSNVSLDPFGNTRFFNPFQFLYNVDGILGDEITIAEVLKQVGYDTALFGKWNLGDYGEYLPTNQGFDYFYGSHYVNDMTPYNFVEERNGKYTEVFSHKQMADQSITTQRITEKMNPYLQQQIANYKQNRTPFFSYYCTPWPHAPLFSNANGNGQGDTTDDTYIDCIEEFDSYLGSTLDLILNDPVVASNTIIIFTSDNGPGKEGATGALKGRKNTTFEGGHKVPMLVKFGDKLKTDDPVSVKDVNGNEMNSFRITSSYMNIDIFPTLLEYMGIPLPTDRTIDGVSMWGAMTGAVGSNVKVEKDGEYRALYYIKKGTVQSLQMPAQIDDNVYDFKYYLNVLNENSAFIDQHYKNYLFNLDTDPIEGYNVSKKYADIAKQLKQQLLSFRKELQTNRRGIKK